MAIYYFEQTADGSGEGSQTEIINGELAMIRVEKDGAGDPDVTVKEAQATQQTVLNGVTVTGSTNYYPRVATQDNAGAGRLYASGGEAVSDRYQLNGPVTVSFTGATVDTGVVRVWVQTYDR